MTFDIGKITVGGSKTCVIAEVGVNHLKNLDLAEELISSATNAGADIVKFQTYSADTLTTKNAPRFWSWSGEHDSGGSQRDSYAVLATPELEFTRELVRLCEKHDVAFMSTPFDDATVDVLEALGSAAYKIASGDITNFPLIRKIAKTGKPLFLSTGASSIQEIKSAVAEIEKINKSIPVCIMHCTLCYPTRAEHANLSAILDLQKHFPNHILGLSDHTIGPAIPSASILYGVKAIEKHYTCDKTLPDSADHWLSIDEAELSVMTSMLRQIERAIGHGTKDVLRCEEIARSNARRSLVVKGSIKKGEKFSSENIIPKRPGFGISPDNIDEIIGLTSTSDLADDAVILPEHVLEDASFKPIMEALLLSKGNSL